MVQPALTRSQIDQFLSHLQLPNELHHATPSLSLLKTLHVHILAACPYENLSIHYNQSHKVLLNPDHLFRKIVTDKRGRGGYCMELAIFYNHVLRGLGFDAYTAGVRTRARLQGVPQGDYPGWVHIVNIVTLPPSSPSDVPEKYHVDVAFGGDGPTAPIPLISGHIHQNIGTQQVRLVRDWIPTQIHRTEEAKLWIYQYRNAKDREWNSFYAFPELEFMAADWEVVNLWTGSSDRSWQTSTVLMIKFLRRTKENGEDGEQEIYGKRMLVNGIVKENLGGKTQVIADCKTETERIAAMDQYFGLILTAEEVRGIRGWVSDLDRPRGPSR
ncbi:hypothetical protein BJ170DRAFT_632123 [Xylariales sp. AK1849]|nr:hypothetical protein BJ170DRAFT_632123 [Xylariales sp. AK1849]